MITFKTLHPRPIFLTIILATIILFLSSITRHLLFQSTAFELGIYDQVAYLISQGQTPISSFLEIHHLGNHAAWAMYPVGWLYKIYPSVYWLLIIQAICLALGTLPTWHLAKQTGLSSKKSFAVALMYLLYPLIFNLNLFDFHPEVMALPAILAAILAARQDKIFWFTLAIIWVVGCKDALSLTVGAMGFWLFFFEKKRVCGAIALGAGFAWFLIVTQSLIPYFKDGKGPGGVGRYAYLGDSVFAIIKNIFLKPNLVLGRIFSGETLVYFTLLLSPVIWWISPQTISPFIATIPVLAKNILSDIDAQRDLIHQYSLPILPFLLVSVIATLQHQSPCLGTSINVLLGKFLPKNKSGKENHISEDKISQISQPCFSPKFIILWSMIGFLSLAKYGYFWTIYLSSLDTLAASQTALTYVSQKGSVLTTASFAPHLTHRSIVKLTNVDNPPSDLTIFDDILLNVQHPGWNSTQEFATSLVTQLHQNSQFKLIYQQDEVYLFQKNK